MKDSQKVYIRGIKNRGDEVIETLKKLGGINRKSLGGDDKYAYYYINPKGVIDYVYEHEYSPDYLLVKEFYKKIELSEIKKQKPKYKESYYRISWEGRVVDDTWTDTQDEKICYEFGNCFKTYDEAKKSKKY